MHRIEYDIDLEKSLKKIPKSDGKAIREKIESLAIDPRQHGAVKLSGREAYRVRVGDYRIIYEIQDKKLIVLIIAIKNRKEAYQ